MDTAVARLAEAWLAENEFHFAFIYLGGTDIVGHAFGWMSNGYLQAIAHADACIRRVLDVLPQGCTIMITADHGGHDQTHGTEMVEDMTTPLIMVGPSEPGEYTITDAVVITDIAPTIARHFEVKPPPDWIGRPIEFSSRKNKHT